MNLLPDKDNMFTIFNTKESVIGGKFNTQRENGVADRFEHKSVYEIVLLWFLKYILR